jgi:hypothetical protein
MRKAEVVLANCNTRCPYNFYFGREEWYCEHPRTKLENKGNRRLIPMNDDIFPAFCPLKEVK